MKVVWTDGAREKLGDFAELVFREAGPHSALKWLEGLETRVKILEAHPEAGRHLPEVRRKDIRELLYRSHRVIYKLDCPSDSCIILSLRHVRQKTTRSNFDS